MRRALGAVMEWVDKPFCRWGVCLFVRFPFMRNALDWCLEG